MRNILSLCVVAFLITACASTKITNWDSGGKYKYYDENGKEQSDDKKLIDPLMVNVSLLPLPKSATEEPENPKTFFDLDKKVQNELLRTLNSNTTKNKEILDAIASNLYQVKDNDSKNELQTDYTKIQVRAVFSNIKQYFNDKRLIHPNTRLAFLNTTLCLDETQFQIYSIDKLENDIETIDLGTLNRENNVQFKSNLEAGTSTDITDTNNETSNTTDNFEETDQNQVKHAKTNTKNTESNKSITSKNGINGKVSYDIEDKIKEAMNLKLKRMKTGFSLKNGKELTIMQQGSLLNDISDNTIVTLTFKEKEENLKNKNNVVRFTINQDSLEKSGINMRKIQFFSCNKVNDIKLTTSYNGLIRSAESRGKWLGVAQSRNNILEFDDKVIYYKISRNKDSSNILIFNNYNFCKQLLKVKITFNNKDKKYFYIKPKNQQEQALLFEDYQQASIFINYIDKLFQLYTNSHKTEDDVKKIFRKENFEITLNSGEKIIGENPNKKIIDEIIKAYEIIDEMQNE